MRRVIAILILVLSGLVAPASAWAQSAPACQFILGFQTLDNLDTADIGTCIDNQAFAANGDAQQHTLNGLMAWRKLDNWTAFTNGYQTWINGPTGLAKRLNTLRFSWEANPDGLRLADASAPAASAPAASAAQPLPAGSPPGATRFAGVADTTVDFVGSFGEGHFHAAVNDALRSTAIVDPDGAVTAAPGNGIYAIFLLTVTNVGNSTATVADSRLSVQDAQGRVFTYEQTPDQAWLSVGDEFGMKNTADSLGPSLTEKFALVYVVAQDSTSPRLISTP